MLKKAQHNHPLGWRPHGCHSTELKPPGSQLLSASARLSGWTSHLLDNWWHLGRQSTMHLWPHLCPDLSPSCSGCIHVTSPIFQPHTMLPKYVGLEKKEWLLQGDLESFVADEELNPDLPIPNWTFCPLHQTGFQQWLQYYFWEVHSAILGMLIQKSHSLQWGLLTGKNVEDWSLRALS